MKPTIAITAGDLAGIGPEIIAKALNHQAVYESANFLIIGDRHHILKNFQNYSQHQLEQICLLESYSPPNAPISIVDITQHADLSSIKAGQLSALSGQWSFNFLEYGINLVKQGQSQALVTAPINKTTWKMATINYPGHTEVIARQTNTTNYAMAFYSEPLKIILETIHIPLSQVATRISQQTIYNKIILAHQFLKQLGFIEPRIGVAGLNPHAGEHGLLGQEDSTIILPAVEQAKSQGINVAGPLPADTIFYAAYQEKKFDMLVAMYHDQGLAPLKMVAIHDAVNITLGLPIIRTSPDHGTAYDIAGQGIANESSMLEALKLALKLA